MKPLRYFKKTQWGVSCHRLWATIKRYVYLTLRIDATIDLLFLQSAECVWVITPQCRRLLGFWYMDWSIGTKSDLGLRRLSDHTRSDKSTDKCMTCY